jgi:hypothetical protein
MDYRGLDYQPKGSPLFLGNDYGFRNPFACLWAQPIENGERLVILREYYQAMRTTQENALAIQKIHQEAGYGQIAAVHPDPSSPEGAAVLAAVLGVPIIPPGLRNVAKGQELVRQWLKVRPDGCPGLLIHHRCKNLIRELLFYLNHEPGKGKHHAVDALRYLLLGWLGY